MVVLPSIRRKYMVGRIPKGATVPMSDCVVTLASDKATYTGSARTVGVTVTWEGAELAVNADYTLSYANNVNLGPATVTVTGMGQFSGSVTKTFHIVAGSSGWGAFDLANTSFVRSASLSDGGNAITGAFHVQILPDGRLFFADSATSRMYVWRWTDDGPSSSYDSRAVGDPNTPVNFSYGAYGATMAKNGLTLLYAGNNWGNTYIRHLTTAFDLSSMNGAQEQAVAGARTVQSFSHDGRFFALKQTSGNEFYVYNMETPYDYANATALPPYNMSNYDASIKAATGEASGMWYGMCFSGDGHALVVVWGACVLKFLLETAWDVQSASLDSFFKPTQSSGMRGVGVDTSGEKMFLVDSSGVFYEYNLSA